MWPKDTRQSDNWGEFLKQLGWKVFRLSNGSNLFYRSIFFGSIAKLQRPTELGEKALLEIDEFCKKNRMLFLKLEPTLSQDVGLLEKLEYKKSPIPLSPASTMYIDLRLSTETLWEKISKSGKYSINRAKREKTTTEIFTNPDQQTVERFYKILKYTGHSKKFYVPPFKDIYLRAKAFGKDAHIIFVKDGQGNDAGAKLYVGVAGEMALYVCGGTTEPGHHNKAGYQLLWDSIVFLKNQGYSVLDLEGINDPRFANLNKRWGGFTEFKNKFGGEEIRFPYPYIKFYSLVFKLWDLIPGFGM